ncbi:MAG: rhodanese-related sulfurtransferase, partial [Nanoarchaeota archaeon]|nr:rhodanese-related sulfurtransferase [Nanoarchaeota archaeon]
MLQVATFYKYNDIQNPREFAQKHLSFCNSLGIKGRIIVATEGINGTVCGTSEQIEAYKKELSSNELFSGIEFKEDECLMYPFNKMNIKIKPELVRFEQPVSYKDAGQHLSPQEFLEMAKQEEVIVLDARNSYESKVGKFNNAITPDIETFREFPKVVESLKDKKDKKILMYCTGGIRCEKASAFMKKEGFSNVYQLHGGILNFGKYFPDQLWEGKCFVFDNRLISSINTRDNPITECETCKIPCDLYRNCRNKKCNKLAIICPNCEHTLSGCCSSQCLSES